MRIYAIGDLHLSGAFPKPMDVFGSHWTDHWKRISKHWIELVGNDDVVLIPGDISWAMKLEDALVDLRRIGELPGRKVMIRGNHDYWWNSVARIRSALPPGMFVLQNDSVEIDGIHFCGTRGWIAPGQREYTEHDLKIFKREVERLGLSLLSARNSQKIILLLHYPPFDDKGAATAMIEKMRGFSVSHVVYGHLHGPSYKATEGDIDGVTYHLVSCDYLNFVPKLIV